MYRLGKRVLSQYIRTGCLRRLRLDLYRGVQDRRAADVPEKDAGRPGLALLARQGKDYERAKYRELEEVFGNLVVRGEDRPYELEEDRAFEFVDLETVIDGLEPHQLVLEAQYPIGDSFRQAHDLADLENGTAIADDETLSFDALRPDILQVQPPVPEEGRRILTPFGSLIRIDAHDERLGLRVIDIKIAGEPSPAHFSELAYYGMALAGWLEDTGHSDRFVVLAEAAIWPGAHDGSTIRRYLLEDRAAGLPRLDLGRYLDGLDADLEPMPPEVVLGRVQRFLRVDLRQVLSEPDWRALDWHIDNRCAGCDYLGYRWARHDNEAAERAPANGPQPDERYCWPMAERTQHLSRVAGLTEGACGKLRKACIPDIGAVSALPAGSPVYESHQMLRAKRTVLSARATTLHDQTEVNIPHRAGTSAVLPRFADIRVSVSADFDIGSGLTFALGYRLNYGVPNELQPRGIGGPRYRRRFATIERPMLVLERTLQSEGTTLQLWLQHLIRDIHRTRTEVLEGYREHGNHDRRDVTIQFFLWDLLNYRHLCRVFGRHLDLLQDPVAVGDDNVSPIAWVFPAESLLEEPDFVSRSSPITIVGEVVNSLIAAPIPHHYGMIDVANELDPGSRLLADGEQWWFHVNKFYRDPLSDQIPSERGHEIWNRASPFPDQDFQWHQDETRKVVRRKLHAVAYVAEKLTGLLRDELSSQAPRVGDVFQPAGRLAGVGDDGQILFQHTRLMAAAQRLEIDLLMAMPPHEREARFRSARVESLLEGIERLEGLDALGIPDRAADPSVLLFRLSERSREARLKEGEFLWSFLPEVDLPDLQDLTVAQFKTRNSDLEVLLPTAPWEWQKKVRDDLTVTILKVDRGSQLLGVEAGELLTATLRLDLLQMNLDGSQGRFGILDPVAMDAFTPKIRKTLADQTGIRNPPLAQQRPLFPNRHIARVRPGRPRVAQEDGPAAEFIWNADQLAATDSGIAADPVLAIAQRVMPDLTARQSEAIARAVTRRFALWWGPPGTGKSRTAQAYLAALAVQAAREGRSLRLAISGLTWVAIDNVARGLPELLQDAGVANDVHLSRLNSSTSTKGVNPLLAGFVTPMGRNFHLRRIDLERRLTESEGVTIVASTVDQLYKLGDPARCVPLFDIVLIDEASQLDVAHAVVAFSKLAADARVVVVGDDKQMSPIHPLEAPDGLEHLLGSVYDFFRHYRRHEGPQFAIEPVMLNRSFRSNREIVAFVREAGYGDDLEAADANAGLRLSTVQDIETALPADWPEHLPFCTHFARILAPGDPLVSVVHSDRFSSQRNDGEADLAAGLVLALFRAGLCDLDPGDGRPYSPDDFFRKGVGIVTPHRAQQAAVYDRLAAVLPAGIDRNLVFDSIDTVERFQGQEKAVMIASFGLGDADQIAAEEQFIYSLNRFNVTASRAQAKFVALISRPLVDYLPRDRRALVESRLLKHFVDGFLSRSEQIALPGFGLCDLKF